MRCLQRSLVSEEGTVVVLRKVVSVIKKFPITKKEECRRINLRKGRGKTNRPKHRLICWPSAGPQLEEVPVDEEVKKLYWSSVFDKSVTLLAMWKLDQGKKISVIRVVVMGRYDSVVGMKNSNLKVNFLLRLRGRYSLQE